jgi:hypothetical protein
VLVTLLVIVVAACLVGLAASVIMAPAARSAFFNIAFGGGARAGDARGRV